MDTDSADTWLWKKFQCVTYIKSNLPLAAHSFSFLMFPEQTKEIAGEEDSIRASFKGIDQWEKRWEKVVLFDRSRCKLFMPRFLNKSVDPSCDKAKKYSANPVAIIWIG